MEKNIRLALIGCGEHGTATLLPTLMSLPNCDVPAVCDLDLQKAQAAARIFGVGEVHTDTKSLFDTVQLDGIVLAGSPRMHYEVAKEAISRRLHVFVEKPPAETGDQVRELADLADEYDVVTMVGLNFRHTTAWLAASRLLQAEDAGQVIGLELSYLAGGPRGPRWSLASPFESFLLTHAIHAFDLAVATLGRASRWHVLTRDADDGAILLMAQLLFDNGKAAVLTVGTASAGLQFEAKIITERSHVIRVDGSRNVTYLRPGDDDGDGRRFERIFGGRTLDSGFWSSGYGSELSTFLSAICGRARPIPSLRDALGVYEIIDRLAGRGGDDLGKDALPFIHIRNFRSLQ